MKILIVGSGPSAYSSLIYLLNKKDIQVDMIDNSNINEQVLKNGCIYNNTFKHGNRINNEIEIYDNAKTFSNNAYPSPSKSFGGFSNVWGGTVFEPKKREIETYKTLGIDIKKYYQKIISDAFILSSDSSFPSYSMTLRERNLLNNLKSLQDGHFKTYFSKTWLLNDSQNKLGKIDICDFCGSYTWDCSGKTIWNSKNFIKKQIELKKVNYLENTKLISFKEDFKKVNCNLIQSNKSLNKTYDKVFLCSGVISTSLIIMNSTDIKQVEVKISDLLSIPFVNLYRKGEKRHSLSDLFVHKSTNESEVFLQIYGFSRGLLNLANDAVPITRFIKKLPNFLFKNFGGIFMYLNQENSSSLRIIKTPDGITFEPNNANFDINKELKALRKYLLKGKVFPLYILKKNYKFGKSNHYGGQFSHAKSFGDVHTDRVGRLKNLDNVHILDSSVLPIINTGPLTATMMANSYRITEEVFESYS